MIPVKASNFPGHRIWIGRMPRIGSLQIFSNHVEIFKLFKVSHLVRARDGFRRCCDDELSMHAKKDDTNV